MKTLKIFAVAALSISLLASCNSNNDPKVDVAMPSQALVDSTSYLVGINFGYFIKANGFGENLNYAEIKKGMMDFINSEGNQYDPAFNEQFKISPDTMNEIFSKFISSMNEYKAAVNQAKGEKFLEANKMKDGVVTTDSGLQYKIIEEGNEVHPAAADTVWVQYKGTTIDGEQFDASNPENPAVKMILSRVIAGWTEGLQFIGEGGKIELYIPAELAYGERGSGPVIGPNSTLIFEVELEKVGKVAEAAAEE